MAQGTGIVAMPPKMKPGDPVLASHHNAILDYMTSTTPVSDGATTRVNRRVQGSSITAITSAPPVVSSDNFTVTYDGVLEQFTVTYNFTIIKRVPQGNPARNETPFYYEILDVESSAVSTIFPQFTFDKPAAGSQFVEFLWDPIMRVNPGNVESVWWNSFGGTAVGSDAITIDREVLESGLTNFRTSLARFRFFDDGTFTTWPSQFTDFNPFKFYMIDYEVSPMRTVTYNIDNLLWTMSVKAWPHTLISNSFFGLGPTTFSLDWGTASTPVPPFINDAPPSANIKKAFLGVSLDANGKLAGFSIIRNMNAVVPNALFNFTVTDGDQLKLINGLLVGKA